jgi:hypothetical protein
MSWMLNSTMTFNTNRTQSYIWPLIFEIINELDFIFENPTFSGSESHGQYLVLSNDIENRENASFADLWSDIYNLNQRIYASFWSKHEEQFQIYCGIEYMNNAQQAQISFDLPGESLNEEFLTHPNDINARFTIWIEGIIRLLKLLLPLKIDIETNYAGDNITIGSLVIDQGFQAERNDSNSAKHKIEIDSDRFILIDYPIVLPGGRKVYYLK